VIDGYLSLLAQPGTGTTLPAGSRGLDVQQPLHRFDSNVHLPTRERGVSSANRVGEPLALLTMQWRFDPPDTELRGDASQQVAMRDGGIAFYDAVHGSLQFSGAGHTYPATTDGQPRLLFAGIATVTGGTGSLDGAHGTLLIAGEVTRLAAVSLSVVGRIDAGTVLSEDTLSPLRDQTRSDPPATQLTLVGRVGSDGRERLHVARIGTDIARRDRLRSLLRLGSMVGYSTATTSSRVLTFCDPAGITIGSITAQNLQTANRSDRHDGHATERRFGYGAAARGTGALTGAGGLLTFETTLAASGEQSTLYSLLLVDPKGRFRASFADVYQPMPAVRDGTAATAASDSVALQFVDGDAAAVSSSDRAMLRAVEGALADGAELAQWLDERERTQSYRDSFALAQPPDDVGRSLGFFDTAAVGNSSLPVIGAVQEMFFDRQSGGRDRTREQLQSFALKYFLRVAARTSLARTASGQRPRRSGGYRQLYYKRRDSGKIGRFTADQQAAIVDLREIGTVYDWIVLQVDAFDFTISFAPFSSLGPAAPLVQLPLQQRTSYLVIGPPLIRNQEQSSADVLGRYGFGYAFVPYSPDDPGVIAYGPGHFSAAVQTVDFSLLRNGDIRARAGFVVSRPNQMARVDVDPIDWGFKLADVLTFGAASRLMSPVRSIADTLPLRITGLDPIATSIWIASAIANGMADRPLADAKEQFEKGVLTQHAAQHRELLSRAVLVWRMAADWTDEARVPTFVREGAA
jgi:hypothetical protein